MEIRTFRRLKIIFGFLFFGLLFFGAVVFFLMSETSCFDSKRNQAEEGVDCGGPCRPCDREVKLHDLEIISVDWVADIGDKYDVVAKISNPNEVYGLSNFSYRVVLKDQAGVKLVESSWQKGYVLPGEKKSLLVQGVVSEKKPAKVDFELNKDLKWEKFSNDKKPNLIINNSKFDLVTGGGVGFARAMGTLVNKSSGDFQEVWVKVILKDSSGKLLAVNSQVVNTLRAGEKRDYLIIFPHSFVGNVADQEVEPDTNAYDVKNYVPVKSNVDLFR